MNRICTHLRMSIFAFRFSHSALLLLRAILGARLRTRGSRHGCARCALRARAPAAGPPAGTRHPPSPIIIHQYQLPTTTTLKMDSPHRDGSTKMAIMRPQIEIDGPFKGWFNIFNLERIIQFYVFFLYMVTLARDDWGPLGPRPFK